MKKNIGFCDRTIRLIISMIIMVVGAWYHSWWGVVGAPIFVSALMGYCGLYSIFGTTTCKVNGGDCTCGSCDNCKKQGEV